MIVLVIGLAMGGYYFWKNRVSVETPETKVVNELQEVTESITESVVQGSTIPSLGDTTKVTNPLENVQDTNPYSNTNPFSDIKVNPFE
ncbi:hypothetical protein KJ671_01940 [Patescibacteria group bacterium]|nr:hypothetical protein [Patescibacteria group bacterium]